METILMENSNGNCHMLEYRKRISVVKFYQKCRGLVISQLMWVLYSNAFSQKLLKHLHQYGGCTQVPLGQGWMKLAIEIAIV